ncbi:hypothetical protein CBS101457_003023 [Exobasidium rhododendri]|nr:hypothetical protein CBS101457_003023 [Exobasidium rhododendri]
MEAYHQQLEEYNRIVSANQNQQGEGAGRSRARHGSSSSSGRRSTQLQRYNERPNQLIWNRRSSAQQRKLLLIVNQRRGIDFRDAREALEAKLTLRLEEDVRCGRKTVIDAALRSIFPINDRHKIPVWMEGLTDDDCESVVNNLRRITGRKKAMIRNRLMRFQVTSDTARRVLAADDRDLIYDLVVRIGLREPVDENDEADNDDGAEEEENTNVLPEYDEEEAEEVAEVAAASSSSRSGQGARVREAMASVSSRSTRRARVREETASEIEWDSIIAFTTHEYGLTRDMARRMLSPRRIGSERISEIFSASGNYQRQLIHFAIMGGIDPRRY